MTDNKVTIRPEQAEDRPAVALLEAMAFGPGRFARTAYRVRERSSVPAVHRFVAEADAKIVGSLRFTPVRVGGDGGVLLLGPLVVDPRKTGQRLGLKLIEVGVAEAKTMTDRLVLLVGDAGYYQRAGFQKVPVGQILMPGPVDLDRLLCLELYPGAANDYAGVVEAI